MINHMYRMIYSLPFLLNFIKLIEDNFSLIKKFNIVKK